MFRSINSEVSIGECPFCSSEAFKFKEGNKLMFLCHSCQRYMPFEKTGVKDEITTNNISNYNSIISLCQRIDTLPAGHRFRLYAESRQIPLDRVYYTDKFDVISEYAETPVKDKERLILPFYKEDGTLFGIQGRSLDKGQIRYITLMFDKDHPKLFGLEKLDTSKTIIVVEGPIDSMFVNNAISMAGSDANLNKYKDNSIIALDNEPRNRDIVSKMAKYLDNGFKVVIWPEKIKEKDMNDMFLAGISPDYVIRNNVYSGLTGKIKLNQWKKV